MISFSEKIIASIAWTVMHSLWQCMIISLLAASIVILSKTKSASYRYKVYCGALLAIVIASSLTFAYLSFTYNDTPNEQFTQTINGDDAPFQANQATEIAKNIELESASILDDLSMYMQDHLPVIAFIWLIGLFLSILRLIGGISYVNYLKNAMNFPADEHWIAVMNSYAKKLNIEKHIDLLESALVRSPIVIGHLKPIILFPIGFINKLNTNEVEAIISHEMAHIMRNDYFVNLLINVVESLYYYHPAVWWLSSQAKEERENCC
ncbi:MAG: hypothetical protein RLZZ546_2369, partial [Bacteroidota bacterium]